MPADALPIPHGQPVTLLPGGITGFTLTFGAYADPAFAGMKGILRLPVARANVTTGDVLQQSWSVTIASDGTGSIADLPYTDDPAFTGAGQLFSLEWQALSYKPTPGNKVFAVNRTDGATIDYDLLPTAQPVSAPQGNGVTLANLDALVAALLASPSSQSRAAAVNLPNYPNGA